MAKLVHTKKQQTFYAQNGVTNMNKIRRHETQWFNGLKYAELLGPVQAKFEFDAHGFDLDPFERGMLDYLTHCRALEQKGIPQHIDPLSFVP